MKDCALLALAHFITMSRVVRNNRGFLQLLADCPPGQRQFLSNDSHSTTDARIGASYS